MPNRTVCDVLSEMRTCVKTLNFSYVESLIEECQTLANRMEASLWDQKDYDSYKDSIREIKAELKTLKKEKSRLQIEAVGVEYDDEKVKDLVEALKAVACVEDDKFISSKSLMKDDKRDLVDTIIQDTISCREALVDFGVEVDSE